MAAAGNLLIPVETDEQLQQRLLTSLEPLRGSLPDLTPFTVQSVLDINLTVDHYIKAMKPLVSFAQQGIFESIVASAGTAQIINNVMRPRTRDLYAIASWVKTEHGQNAITKIITTRKLQKSAKGMRTAPEMAWVSLFTSQQADYAQERKRKLQRFERKRAELKRQLAQVDADQEASLGRLAARYPVQAQYQSIPVEDLVNRSWEAYLADCNVRNAPALPKNNQNLTMAVDRFGPLVRDAVIGEYCVLENVKAQLRKYAEEKILHLETVNEKPSASRFRNLFAAATGEAAPVIAPHHALPPPRVDPIRDPVAQRREDELHQTIGRTFGFEPAAEGPAGDQVETGDSDTSRTESQSSLNTQQQRKSKRLKERAAGGSEADPPRKK
ncbi:ORF2 [Camellia totivirus A]|nr:ORF2 [Camellia totivirus A]